MGSNVLLALADWFGAHGVPTIAGFVGGIAGAEVRARWIRHRAAPQKGNGAIVQNLPAYPIARSWIGAILALLILVLDVVFLATGQIELKTGLLVGGLALALLI